MALRSLVKAVPHPFQSSSTVHLYRAALKEIPRVLILYDVDVSFQDAKNAITYHFRKNADVEDYRF